METNDLTPEQVAELERAEEEIARINTKTQIRNEKNLSITERMKLIYERESERLKKSHGK